MNLKEVIEYMKAKPYTKRMGCGLLSKRCKCSSEVIKEAKRQVWSPKIPKVLILDIETAPMKAYVWKRWKENISLDQTISEWFCLCWSAKWLCQADTMSEVLTPEEVMQEKDSRIMKILWELLNEADIVVTHNGDKFDLPRINSRFIINDLPPTTPYYSVDTCKVCKKQFGFSSNKLDALAGYFGFNGKLDTSFELWKGCMEGDKYSLLCMEQYNIQDVVLLEEVYIKLRPWIKGHPNVGNFMDPSTIRCSNCGSDKVTLIDDEYYTSVNVYPLYRCKCGCISRGRKAINKDKVQLTTIGK